MHLSHMWKVVSGVQKSIAKKLLKFDKNIWPNLIQFVTIYGKDDIRFTFKDGSEVPV